MLEKILVAVDGSEYSQKALELACQLTEKFDGSLHILHVPQGAAADRVMVLGGASVMIHAGHEQIEKAGRTLIEAARKIAEERVPGKVRTELRGGDPADEGVAELIAAALDGLLLHLLIDPEMDLDGCARALERILATP
jgi:nucleotide-binding universal stress UspA family protein